MILLLILCVVIIILVIAAINDIKYRRIPNILSLLIVALYLFYVVFNYLHLIEGNISILDGLLTGGIMLLFGLLLFAVGAMGGGDVKLLVAVSLFAGKQYILPVLILTTLCGGLVAGVIWLLSKKHPKQNKVDGSNRHSVPYGVAISVSGIWLCIQLLNVGSFA